MTDQFNTKIDRFRMPDGSVAERRTEIKGDGSFGEVRGSEVILGLTDDEIAAAGIAPSAEDAA